MMRKEKNAVLRLRQAGPPGRLSRILGKAPEYSGGVGKGVRALYDTDAQDRPVEDPVKIECLRYSITTALAQP